MTGRKHIAPQRYEDCIAELSDRYKAIFNYGSNKVPNAPLRGSITGGKIIRVDQADGKKPHYAIVDKDGNKVFESTSYTSAMRRRLERLEGREVERYAWSTETYYGETSHNGDKTVCELKVKPADRPTPTGTPIEALYLDTETTGLDPERDEILQLSLINEYGDVLWNRKYMPEHTTSWPEAESVNHISPADVMGRPSIEDEMSEIQKVFDRAQKVYAWNAVFDLAFLARAGLRYDFAKVSDSMDAYAKLKGRRHYYKLFNAALECGYTYKAHDSLEDTRALKVVQDYIDGKGGYTPVSSNLETRSHLTIPTPQMVYPTSPSRPRHAQTRSIGHRIARGILITLEVIFALFAILWLAMIFSNVHDSDSVIGGITFLILSLLLVLLCEWGRRKL